MTPTVSELSPPHTLGGGLITEVDVYGNIQAFSYTGTPPYGELPLHDETVSDADQGIAPIPRVTDAQMETFLHEQIHGTPWHGYDIQHVVNGDNPGIPNLGPVNEQDFQSGHTQITVENSSAEQGWGMDPAILYARFPRSDGANPDYASGIHRRNGTLDWDAPGIPFSQFTQGQSQLQWQLQRRSGQHTRVIDPATGVPFVEVVPVYGQAGPIPELPNVETGVLPFG